MGKFIDMTGWIMSEHGVPDSRLRVIKRAKDYIYSSGLHATQWECECSCEEHNHIIVMGSDLRKGNTKSCGCLKEEMKSQLKFHAKKYNQYDLSKKYGIGWTYNTNTEFYFDLEDYDKIKDHCWSDRNDHGVHYVVTCIEGKQVFMHNLLGYKGYDHIDRNGLNNKKSNLRKATIQQNNFNNGIAKNNTSGYTGVYFQQKSNKYTANIGLDYQNIYLGCFENKKDAIRARLEAEAKYYGEFAPQRHLFEQYGITIQNDKSVLEPIENLTTEETNDDCI